MRQVDNIFHLLISKDVDRTASVQVLDSSNATTFLAEGEIVVTDKGGTVLNTTTVDDVNEIVVWQGQGPNRKPIKSDVIERSKAYTYNGNPFEADEDQVTFVGFNGTNGEIDVIDDKKYILRYIRREGVKTFGDKMMYKYASHESSSSATQEEIATGLTKSFIKNWKDEPDKFAIAERVNSGTKTNPSAAGTGDIDFVKGSKTVTAATAGDIDQVDAGDWIAVGTGDDAGIYKIVDKTGAVLTLDIPVQTESVTVSANTAVALLSAAVDDFGIKVTGQDGLIEEGIFPYDKTRFTLTGEIGETLIRTETEAYDGIGLGVKIAQLEWEEQGNRGKFYRASGVGRPGFIPRKNADSDGNYSILNVEWKHDKGTGINVQDASFKQLMIAIKLDASNEEPETSDQATTGVRSVLNQFFDGLFPSVGSLDEV